MENYRGFILVVDEEARAEIIKNHIESRKSFTEALGIYDWPKKECEIFLISLDGKSFHCAALAKRGKQYITAKHSIKFSNFVIFGHEISFTEIENELPSKLKNYFTLSTIGKGIRVDPITWLSLIDKIRELRPESKKELDSLIQLRNAPVYADGKYIIAAEKKDTANVSLRLSDMNIEKLEEYDFLNERPNSDIIRSPNTNYSAELIEDRMIEWDARVFGDLRQVHADPMGRVVFNDGNKHLSVQNVHRGPLERILGIDLIYYHYHYKSYVMVQYKRMEVKNARSFYRPKGDSYEKEMERMTFFRNKWKDTDYVYSKSLSDYRLNFNVFYFKLCPKIVYNISSTEMIPGMYIPFDYWELLINSEHTVGPRGGKVITQKNVERHLSNTEFIDLVRHGWIGSKLMQTEHIQEIVDDLLESGHVVTLANYQRLD